ncbi:unnamed protein product [Prorocentrum cordatum]|uniref:Uncharacterized protein n=1 Tax=Prorocentrum cordatum TaxID=2364126 RepID=A0ABN9SY45_9DINO|nr:unnamed protein product [Polarella glacialis]
MGGGLRCGSGSLSTKPLRPQDGRPAMRTRKRQKVVSPSDGQSEESGHGPSGHRHRG